jgi:cytochrome c-type biogenesis protein CcsB
MQLFLDMHVDPEFWKNQKMIVVRDQSLRNILGISGKYASFNDFDENGYYKLDELSQRAFQKKASDQSSMEREILNVTDRVNIFLMAINGTLLKLFPVQSSANNKWVSWNDSLAFYPLSGDLMKLNDDLQLSEFNYSNIMRSYLISTIYARESGDYTVPNRILGNIKSLQRQITPANLLPSERKINLEIFYNKSKIFDNLKYVYALLGIVLLILSFFENFKINPGKNLQTSIKVFVVFFIAAFMYQTFGMGLRWYLGGHAPWSNGYEVLLLVAWGSILAGFSVIRYSKITLASTAILASIILMVAGLSYYDPQLTNLNPVLKSYWLIIHVAIITIGYGFLGLSFLLGLINIMISLFKHNNKSLISPLVIQELTFINEKLVTIGMLLTAIGTFIGCIWANESWGNYWSWNAKQTWSLIIILIYGLVLHFKYIPKMKSPLTFNIGVVISFGSVIMTFVGVNYYFTKGLHSYASDDPPIFPVWAWITIIALFSVIVAAIVKENYFRKTRIL